MYPKYKRRHLWRRPVHVYLPLLKSISVGCHSSQVPPGTGQVSLGSFSVLTESGPLQLRGADLRVCKHL